MDQRFPVDSDPRFIRPKKRGRVVLDARFSSILDPDFSEQPVFDPYGRRLKHRRKGAKEIESLYVFPGKTPGDSSSFLAEKKDLKKKDPNEAESLKRSPEESLDLLGDESPSSDEAFSSDWSSGEVELADPEPEIEIPRGEMTSRLGVVNLDWDHVRSVDIFAALGSFVPKGGRILSVKVYLSEFGKKRMEKEDTEGPPRDIFCVRPTETVSVRNQARDLEGSHEESENGADGADDAEDTASTDDEVIQRELVREDRGSDFNMAQLRKYQLERLRYYYAIVVCDSIDTAKNIYRQCDGREYEASANFFDLRFVPDGESFDSVQIRDECSSLPEGYVPEEFVTDALKHSNVRLIWDNDDPVYLQMVKRAFSGKEIDENDFKVYLASTDSEASDTEAAEKYRSLLLNKQDILNDQKGSVGGMQVTFMPGLDGEGSDEVSVETSLERYKRKERERKRKKRERHCVEGEGLQDLSDRAEADLGFDDPFFSQEPVQPPKTRRRAKEKKKDRRLDEDVQKAQLELLMVDDYVSRGDGVEGYNAKDADRSGKKRVKLRAGEAVGETIGDGSDIDLEDPRFSAMYSSHHFDIDPTHPRFKKTDSMMKMMRGRQQRQDRVSLG